MNCDEMVEIITDYLEETLSRESRSRFERHLEGCPACLDYLNQMRVTLRLARGSGDDRPSAEMPTPPVMPAALLRVFRDWKADKR